MERKNCSCIKKLSMLIYTDIAAEKTEEKTSKQYMKKVSTAMKDRAKCRG